MNVFIYFFLSTDNNTSILSIEDIKEKEASLLVPTPLPSNLNVKECHSLHRQHPKRCWKRCQKYPHQQKNCFWIW